MTVGKWIQLLAPAIGVLISVILLSLTYFFVKVKQIRADQRRSKEEYYLNYLEAVNDVIVPKRSDEAYEALANAQCPLLLIASSSVVSDIVKLHKYIDSCSNSEVDLGTYNELLNNLLKNMKIDLGKHLCNA
jgi:hypothetical protein